MAATVSSIGDERRVRAAASGMNGQHAAATVEFLIERLEQWVGDRQPEHRGGDTRAQHAELGQGSVQLA
ncbi:hypothetical protein [Serratia marcescens]|uniref:hypothetical protein n=1 Tax=Serratia marcescens TaxID=615 RepID=UPI00311C9956